MALTNAQLLSYANEYRTLKNTIAEHEARLKFLAEQLKASVPTGKELFGDGMHIIHSAYSRSALNIFALKKDQPQLYKSYLKTSRVDTIIVR